MSVRNALGGGLIGGSGDDETVDLRKLVDDIGRRSHDERIHSQSLPERFDIGLWRKLEDAGLTVLTSTPELGAGPVELAIVLHGLARHAAAVPIAEHDLLAAWLVRQASCPAPDGVLTVAIADADVSDGRVKGTAFDAPWTLDAAVVLAARARGSLFVTIVNGDEVDTYERHNLAGEPRNTLRVDLPSARFIELAESTGDELVQRGAWARCVQIVGALDGAAERTLAHTRERVQFGRTLSNFQSVQHSLAAMVGEIERSRVAVALAVAAAADYGFAAEPTRYAVTVAKVVLGQTVSLVNTIAHQLHGAIGVTIEHQLWRYTMRAQSWIGEFGSASSFARQLGHLVLNADDPWDVVIGGATAFSDAASE